MKKAIVFLFAFIAIVLVSSGQNATRLVRPAQRAIDARNARNAQIEGDQSQHSQQQPGRQASAAASTGTNALVSGWLLIKTLDTNNNGIVDAAEISNASEALKTLDANKDGKLTVEEYTASGEPRPCYSPIFKALDLNENGVIDPKEIDGAAVALRMLDKNLDGKLSANEYRPSAAAIAAAASAATAASAPPKQ
jgi:hypothetical protein